ncbi:MAG: MFS transporter [Desulfofustis sp.]|nr:MFS transporter [Desulfofustis sp.]MBT8346976.1 MFS transporter [Desulfofustis sp.]MBT8354148.1 MFS transporter [Desulfofustis sp.]NNK14961.1 MFS transporter [Desulfofustis sp.]
MNAGFVRQILIITVFRLLLNTGRRFIYPFAPALSRGLDVPLAAVTSIIAAGQFTSLLGIFAGPFADRYGCRLMMRAGLAMLALGMLICGLVPLYWPVFVGLVVASFGKTLFDPAIQAYVGNNVSFERRGRVIGIIETAWAGSTLIGIPALALVIDHAGLRNSFYLLAILGGLSWLLLGVIMPADSAQSDAQRTKRSFLAAMMGLLKYRPAAGMLIFGFMISAANDCLFVVYGAWFERDFNVSIVALGFSTVAIGSAELLGESMTALFSDRLGLKRAIILGPLLAISAYLLLPVIGQSLGLAMVGLFLVFLSFEFTIVTSFPLCTEVIPQARATMMAGYYATAGIGRMAGVLIAGFLWSWGGIAGVAAASAGFTFLGLLAVIWGLRGWSPQGNSRGDHHVAGAP